MGRWGTRSTSLSLSQARVGVEPGTLPPPSMMSAGVSPPASATPPCDSSIIKSKARAIARHPRSPSHTRHRPPFGHQPPPSPPPCPSPRLQSSSTRCTATSQRVRISPLSVSVSPTHPPSSRRVRQVRRRERRWCRHHLPVRSFPIAVPCLHR